ncbi:7765_t:CDS:1, partial [Acaulospora morrowiae]
EEPITWSKKPITLDSSSQSFYKPVRKSAAATVGDSIYIFGGENPEIGRLSNAFYKLNIKTFVIKILNSTATPLARKNHSLNAIDSNRLVLFGGRRLINGDDEFATVQEMCDTQDFAIYNIEDNTWVSYTDSTNFPYRRSLHSTAFSNGKLYIYGGKLKSASSTISQIHDDKDIHVYDAQQDSWQKFLAPSNNAAPPTLLPLPTNWIATTGRNPGRRKCAAMCLMHNRIAILGGSEKENWNFETESYPWELLKLLTPENRIWEHIRIKDFPRMDCIAVVREYDIETKGLF